MIRLKSCLFVLALTLSALQINAQTAQFSASVTSGCAPLTVNFTDLSTGTNATTTWEWSFGNGNDSNDQNPGAIYTQPGKYTITLTVKNGATSDSEIKTQYITVYQNPVADFTFSPGSGCSPLPVKFQDSSQPGSGALSQWSWVFGDGGTRTTANPEYTYTTAGDYTVTLTVKNQYGCENTKVKPSIIKARGPLPSFNTNGPAFCSEPAKVDFTSTTPGTGNTFGWNFGDGSNDNTKSPSHTYQHGGQYNAVLTVTDANGCSSNTTTIIHVGSEGGIDFQMSRTQVCIGQPISFTRDITGPVLSSSWKFGDGISSSDINPQHSYQAAGKFTVTLTAQLPGKTCASVVTKEVEVVAASVPSFTVTRGCNNEVTFTNTSSNSVSWQWNFGNGSQSAQKDPTMIIYPPGGYTLKLTTTNSLGCSATLEKTLNIPAKLLAAISPALTQDCAHPSLSVCLGSSIDFKNVSANASSLASKWDFGDGTSSTQPNPSYTYKAKGEYTVTLTVTGNANCKSQTSVKAKVSDVTPVAKFRHDKTKVCVGDPVIFSDESTNADYWCWDFGDGTPLQAGQNISHSYVNPGVYSVTLTAKNGGCSNSFSIANAVTVLDPLVDFVIKKNCLNPYQVELQSMAMNYTSLLWDFGDGSASSTVPVTTHAYAATGNYVITLTATNVTTTCSVKASKSVTIQDVEADFEANNLTPCRGESVKFTDKSKFAVQWQWDFGNGLSSTLPNPEVVYAAAGGYAVTLRVFDSDGCMDEEKKTTNAGNPYVKVLSIQGDFIVDDAVSDCVELSVKFKDNSTANPPITNWKWDFGDGSAVVSGNTAAEQNPAHVYQYNPNKQGNTVSVTLSNAEGECVFIKENKINFTIPQIDFVIYDPGFCIGELVNIYNSSQHATTFSWEFGNGRTSENIHASTVYSQTGEYDVTLKATDDYDCSITVTKQKFIPVTKPVAAFDGSQLSSECPPLVSSFVSKSSNNVTDWQWDFGDGQSSILANPTNVYRKPGIFDVTLTVADANGCSDTTTVADMVRVGGPFGTFTVSRLENCVGDTVLFSIASQNAIVHRLDFGDGAVKDLTENEVGYSYEQAAKPTVSLIFIDQNGCEVAADEQYTLSIFENPSVDFTYHETYPFVGEPVEFTGITEDGTSHEWFSMDSNQGTDLTTTLIFPAPGNYPVTFRTTNATGCSSDTTKTVYVQGDLTMIPNVFTPNGDNKNSTFQMLGLEQGMWNLKVYNRWGVQVYEAQNYNGLWEANNVSTGVYFYIVENYYRREKTYKGLVNVIY